MPISPRPPLALAAACLVALAAIGLSAYLMPRAGRLDGAALAGFMALDGPLANQVLNAVAQVANPVPYALIGVALSALALLRGRPRVALAIVAILVLAGATTQILKPLLATPRPHHFLRDGQIAAASWPSGHATAAMTLCLCAVLAVPARMRPTVAAVGGLFAVAVSYSIVALAWHFPSDVLGGFLVAAIWTLLALAALAALEGHRPSAARAARPWAMPDVAPALWLVAAIAAVAGGVLGARPELLVERTAFAAGAAAIAALAAVLVAMLASTARR